MNVVQNLGAMGGVCVIRHCSFDAHLFHFKLPHASKTAQSTITSAYPTSTSNSKNIANDIHVSINRNNPADVDGDTTTKRNPINNDVIELLSDDDDDDNTAQDGDNTTKAPPLCCPRSHQ